MRDEFRLTLHAAETLYESSIAFGNRWHTTSYIETDVNGDDDDDDANIVVNIVEYDDNQGKQLKQNRAGQSGKPTRNNLRWNQTEWRRSQLSSSC